VNQTVQDTVSSGGVADLLVPKAQATKLLPTPVGRVRKCVAPLAVTAIAIGGTAAVEGAFICRHTGRYDSRGILDYENVASHYNLRSAADHHDQRDPNWDVAPGPVVDPHWSVDRNLRHWSQRAPASVPPPSRPRAALSIALIYAMAAGSTLMAVEAYP
jgi:hypothetical protein